MVTSLPIELAVERSHDIPHLEQQALQSRDILHIRSLLQEAVEYLVQDLDCSRQEALARIEQEARAKKTALSEVARAILTGTAVAYHYDVPI